MDKDKFDTPNGKVATVEEALKRDTKDNQIMHHTFRTPNGEYMGNFNFEVHKIAYSYLMNEKNIIIGHPVILCDRMAAEKLELVLQDIMIDMHRDFVKYANSAQFLQKFKSVEIR
jgi:hypothetical protein